MTLKNIKTILTPENLQSYLDELQQKKSLFTKPMMALLVFVLNRNLKKAEAFRLKFYKFNDIKLYNFVECLINKDYTYLYKVKIKKRNQIAEQIHFTDLFLEYTEKTSNLSDFQDIIDFYNTLAKIRILEASGNIINKLTPETKRILKRIGIKLTGDIQNDTMQIIGKLASYQRKISELSEKIDNKKQESSKAMTFEYFSEAVLAINVTLKLSCSIHTLSLLDYCTYIKRTQNTIEWQKKQSTK
jgi:hypothetical protein